VKSVDFYVGYLNKSCSFDYPCIGGALLYVFVCLEVSFVRYHAVWSICTYIFINYHHL